MERARNILEGNIALRLVLDRDEHVILLTVNNIYTHTVESAFQDNGT